MFKEETVSIVVSCRLSLSYSKGSVCAMVWIDLIEQACFRIEEVEILSNIKYLRMLRRRCPVPFIIISFNSIVNGPIFLNKVAKKIVNETILQVTKNT